MHMWASVRPAGPQPADSAASARRRKAASARRRCSKAAWKGLGDMMKETKVKKVKESVKVKGNRKWKKAMMEAEQMEGETTEATVANSDEWWKRFWESLGFALLGYNKLHSRNCGDSFNASKDMLYFDCRAWWAKNCQWCCPLVTSAQFLWLFQSDSWPKLRLQRRARKRWGFERRLKYIGRSKREIWQTSWENAQVLLRRALWLDRRHLAETSETQLSRAVSPENMTWWCPNISQSNTSRQSWNTGLRLQTVEAESHAGAPGAHTISVDVATNTEIKKELLRCPLHLQPHGSRDTDRFLCTPLSALARKMISSAAGTTTA